ASGDGSRIAAARRAWLREMVRKNRRSSMGNRCRSDGRGAGRTGCKRGVDAGAGADSGSLSVRGGVGSQDRSSDPRIAAMKVLAIRPTGESGFTLIESLVALALMGLVLSALASLTAQWLPNWNRGLDRIQRSEVVGIALQRIADDLAAAQHVPANGDDKGPLFEGSEQSVTFVRTSLGPNAGPGLDVVRLAGTTDA